MSKQIFGTAQDARDHLVKLGFPAFRKGLTRFEMVANGKRARMSLGLTSKTGQSSIGSAASWGYVVTVEPTRG